MEDKKPADSLSQVQDAVDQVSCSRPIPKVALDNVVLCT